MAWHRDIITYLFYRHCLHCLLFPPFIHCRSVPLFIQSHLSRPLMTDSGACSAFLPLCPLEPPTLSSPSHELRTKLHPGAAVHFRYPFTPSVDCLHRSMVVPPTSSQRDQSTSTQPSSFTHLPLGAITSCTITSSRLFYPSISYRFFLTDILIIYPFILIFIPVALCSFLSDTTLLIPCFTSHQSTKLT